MIQKSLTFSYFENHNKNKNKNRLQTKPRKSKCLRCITDAILFWFYKSEDKKEKNHVASIM